MFSRAQLSFFLSFKASWVIQIFLTLCVGLLFGIKSLIYLFIVLEKKSKASVRLQFSIFDSQSVFSILSLNPW